MNIFINYSVESSRSEMYVTTQKWFNVFRSHTDIGLQLVSYGFIHIGFAVNLD